MTRGGGRPAARVSTALRTSVDRAEDGGSEGVREARRAWSRVRPNRAARPRPRTLEGASREAVSPPSFTVSRCRAGAEPRRTPLSDPGPSAFATWFPPTRGHRPLSTLSSIRRRGRAAGDSLSGLVRSSCLTPAPFRARAPSASGNRRGTVERTPAPCRCSRRVRAPGVAPTWRPSAAP